MLGTKGWKLWVAILTATFTVLTLIIATQNLKADTKYHSDGYETSTTATGGKDHNQPIFRAWADYLGKLNRTATINTVKGECDLIAFVAGGTNPPDFKKKFTLKKRFFGLFGDEFWKHHYSSASWSGTNPYAYAKSKGKLGTLVNRTETWRP